MNILILHQLKLSDLYSNEYEWVQKSDIFQMLSNDETEFNVYICSKNTTNIEEFLKVGNFWIVNYYPINFYILLFKNINYSIQILNNLFENIKEPFYKFLEESLLIENNNLCFFITNYKEERLDYLKYAHKNDYPWDET